jgi:hypothetical protein
MIRNLAVYMSLYGSIPLVRLPSSSIDPAVESIKVLVAYQKSSPDALAFLDKMTTAFRWPAKSLLPLEIDPSKIPNLQKLWTGESLRLVWLIDIQPEHVGLFIYPPRYKLVNLPPFQVYCTDSLERIAQSQENKQWVWAALKTVKISDET